MGRPEPCDRNGVDTGGWDDAADVDEPQPRRTIHDLLSIAPGIETMRSYQRGDLRHDVAAGLSVAAVAIPVGVAYAELVGSPARDRPVREHPPAGRVRALRYLAAADRRPRCGDLRHDRSSSCPARGRGSTAVRVPHRRPHLIAGLLCIGASFLRLGALADFLSRPILVGYLAGVALTIALGQIGKLTGLSIEAGGIAPG